VTICDQRGCGASFPSKDAPMPPAFTGFTSTAAAESVALTPAAGAG